MDYQALIFDLDGTAIPNEPEGRPSAKLIETIQHLKHRVVLSAATGRPISNAAPILNRLQLNQPCVIAAGTQIVDPTNHAILWEVSLEVTDIKQVLKICEPYDYEILVRTELLGQGAKARDRDINEPVNVMYVMGASHVDANELTQRMQPIKNITAVAVKAWWHDGLDIHITHRQATKEHALQELFRRIAVDPAQTIGVGDADNDIHLFKAVGHKVAMGNATDKLKSLADQVIGSVDDDGLATFINEQFHPTQDKT